MKSITLKILQDNEKGHSRIDHVLNEFDYILNNGITGSLKYHESLPLDDIKKALINKYQDDIEIQNTVYHGCYGASDGSVLTGFQVYIDTSLFPSRFIDSDFNEVMNIEQLCNEYGQLIQNDYLDAEGFEEAMYMVGFDSQCGNTYNDFGHDGYSCVTLQTADYSIYENGDAEYCYLSIKFHCGGDVRGNYTSKVLYRFDSIDDVYSVLSTSMYIIDEDNQELIDLIGEYQDTWNDDIKQKELRTKINKIFNQE